MKKTLTTICSFLTTLTLVFGQKNYEQNVTVSTFAGSTTSGSTNGQGSLARFLSPYGVTIDAIGNMYVADAGNHSIRKITQSGLVSTLAGSWITGSADGWGSSASFFNPTGVAIDGSGNVYVADNSNHLIRKITPDGLVSTLAGSAKTRGDDNGQGSLARFYFPSGVAVDSIGKVYVADDRNYSIRKITPGGLVSTLAGYSYGSADGQGSLAGFFHPGGVAVDRLGNVYVADQGNNKIRKITPGGLVSTLAGSNTSGTADGQGSLASFNSPTGVSVDGKGNVYVADAGNNLIRKITPGGLVSTLAGSTTLGSADGQGSLASFNYPTGVSVDALGNVYVADYKNHLIRKITIGSSTGIVNDINSSFINIFPNPAQNILNLSLSEEVNATISLIDMQGGTMLSQVINGNTAQLNSSNLSNGVYILKVVTEKSSYTKQVIIAK
jgi:streptogramin lyase